MGNIWMCCCPQTYIKCSKKQVDKTCVSTIQNFIKKRGGGDLDLNGILQVRSELLGSSSQCSKFVHQDKLEAKCGEWPKALPELMCEMLTWQWEELGDGNTPEFDQYKCPKDDKMQAKGGGKRKNQKLNWDA